MTVTTTPQLTDQVVYDYWQEKASESGADPAVTIRDLCFRDLEVDTIKRYLRPSDRVIDIGCGAGHSTLQYAELVSEIVGVDFASGMIDASNGKLEQANDTVARRTQFEVGDARRLDFPDCHFSRVIMERCLINLPDRGEQVEAAREAGRLLQTGELMLLAEVTLQGHERVNHYRKMFGLDTLKVHWHNTYLDEPVFLKAITDTFEVLETIRFGMYGFLSKIVHALLVEPDEPAFDARINEVAARIARKIPDFDGCSHQVLFVLRKKATNGPVGFAIGNPQSAFGNTAE